MSGISFKKSMNYILKVVLKKYQHHLPHPTKNSIFIRGFITAVLPVKRFFLMKL